MVDGHLGDKILRPHVASSSIPFDRRSRDKLVYVPQIGAVSDVYMMLRLGCVSCETQIME